MHVRTCVGAKQNLCQIKKETTPFFAGVVIAQGKGLAFNRISGAFIYIGKMFSSLIANA
jgi:hypothetical protein